MLQSFIMDNMPHQVLWQLSPKFHSCWPILFTYAACCAFVPAIQAYLHQPVLAPHLLTTPRAGLHEPQHCFLLTKATLLSVENLFIFDNLFDATGRHLGCLVINLFIALTLSFFIDGRDRTQSRNHPLQGTYFYADAATKQQNSLHSDWPHALCAFLWRACR